jgi:hypothetical protein
MFLRGATTIDQHGYDQNFKADDILEFRLDRRVHFKAGVWVEYARDTVRKRGAEIPVAKGQIMAFP